MCNTEKFTGLSTNYEKGRPSYSNKFIEDLYTKFGFSTNYIIADIGSGTGKFAEQLLQKGNFVYCIEPNDDMRFMSVNKLKKYKNFQAIKGDASNTSLQNASIDFITAAQAFHWFNVSQFKSECLRILKPDGLVFLIWNIRDITNIFNQRCHEITSFYCPKFKGFGGGIQPNDHRITDFFVESYEYIEYSNPLLYDKDRFISRSLSGSYSLGKADILYSDYITALSQLFDQFAKDGHITMQNKTIVYVGKLH